MAYTVKIEWKKGEGDAFVDNKYSRVHRLIFDGGVEVAGSASPHVVPPPMSSEAAIDPEEMFVASLSSCHMLWFLSLAADKKFVVESYEDNAVGTLGKDADGKYAMTKVTLKPKVVFGGDNKPTPAQLNDLHKEAHEKCFIANSVKTIVTTEAVME